MSKPDSIAAGFDSLSSNVAALETFWNRRTFHDMGIDSLQRVNKRVIIGLDEFFLVLLRVTRFNEDVEEFSTSWISQTVTVKTSTAVLHVEAELGEFEAEFQNFRLLRRNDLTILIPSIDGEVCQTWRGRSRLQPKLKGLAAACLADSRGF